VSPRPRFCKALVEREVQAAIDALQEAHAFDPRDGSAWTARPSFSARSESARKRFEGVNARRAAAVNRRARIA